MGRNAVTAIVAVAIIIVCMYGAYTLTYNYFRSLNQEDDKFSELRKSNATNMEIVKIGGDYKGTFPKFDIEVTCGGTPVLNRTAMTHRFDETIGLPGNRLRIVLFDRDDDMVFNDKDSLQLTFASPAQESDALSLSIYNNDKGSEYHFSLF